MCIAIVALPFKQVSDEHLTNSSINNPDGFGFTYVREDITGVRKIIIKKSMSFEVFLRQYKRAFKHNPKSPFLIHCRIATHGTVDKFNCHPFRIDRNTTFIHNGIISGVGVDSKKSDSQLFNEKVLKQLPKGWKESKPVKMLLEKFLTGSKLAILNIDGEFEIYNESAGHWKDGVWYSNYSYSYGKSSQYGRGRTTTNYPATTGTGYGKKKDNTSTTSKSDKKTFYLCDGCGTRFSDSEMNFFVSRGEPFCYCKECVTSAYFQGTVNLTDKVGKSKFNFAMNRYRYAYGYDEYGRMTDEFDGTGVHRFMD